MNLNDLTPSEGSSSRRTRVGRGIGTGKGKTCGKGTKGQKTRTNIHPNFEGGQTPIHRRLPIKKGFRSINAKEYAIVNLDDLDRLFKAGDDVTPEALQKTGIVHEAKDGIKILGFGELTKKLKVSANKFSRSAAEAIKAAGGEVNEL